MKLTSVAVEKWRIVAAFFAATVSFLLLTLAAFIGSSWIGFKLFFVERSDDDFFRGAVFVLLYGLLGLAVFIYPIFAGSRCVFNKIKSAPPVKGVSIN